MSYRFTDTLFGHCLDYQSDVERIVADLRESTEFHAPTNHSHADYVESLNRNLADAEADLMRMKMCAMEFKPESIVKHSSRCGYGSLDVSTRPDACLSFDISLDLKDGPDEVVMRRSLGDQIKLKLPMSKSKSIKIAKAILSYYKEFPEEYDGIEDHQ